GPKDRACSWYVVERKPRDELARGGLARRRQEAAPRREQTDDALGTNGRFAIRREAGVAVALRQPPAILARDEREVEERRRRQLEGPVEQELSRRRRQEVVAPDHVRHGHRRVVHDGRELIRRLARPLRDHEVAERARDVDPLLAGEEVPERDLAR